MLFDRLIDVAIYALMIGTAGITFASLFIA